MRIPKHVGIIPDGNRRWAQNKGLLKEMGYMQGLNPGLLAYKALKDAGVKEITYYGFTVDNTKRPRAQRIAFTEMCVEAVKLLSKEDAELMVFGNTKSDMFPMELLPYTERTCFGNGGIKVNFLVNYSWEWDLNMLQPNRKLFNTSDISRVDLIIRWGGMRRLSGFLPIQSVYSDFYVVDDYWPDYNNYHIFSALNWYDRQDVTLGG